MGARNGYRGGSKEKLNILFKKRKSWATNAEPPRNAIENESFMTTGTETITVSHWGTYRVTSKNAQILKVSPFENDPEPSPLITDMPGIVHHDLSLIHI